MSNDNHGKAKIKEIKLALSSLAVYRNLLADPVLQSFYRLVDYLDYGETEADSFISLYNEFFYHLFSNSATSLRDYLTSAILYDENFFSTEAAAKELAEIAPAVRQAAANDLLALEKVAGVPAAMLKRYAAAASANSEAIANLPEWDTQDNWDKTLTEVAGFYRQQGTGIFARYRTFIWDKEDGQGFLRGVTDYDPIRFADLIDYERERAVVIENTQHFLAGYPANNILLYGDRGTGKSSTVKALLNEFREQGLRLIEVPKNCLIDFPDIIRPLRNRQQKFIIFVDDLAFTDNEESYTALKAVLEGGVESKPANVLIYATSNRRHLIKEKFSDRAGLLSGNHDDEIRAADTMQEKLSLADRFGITVVFSAPNQQSYLAIVEGLAIQRGLKIDQEDLQREALKWELHYNNRSPRTARQFVDWLQGYLGNLK